MDNTRNIQETAKTDLILASMESFIRTNVVCAKYKGEVYYLDPYNTGDGKDWRAGMGSNKEHLLLMFFNYDYKKMITTKEFEVVHELI